jgi:hypothetical protein
MSALRTVLDGLMRRYRERVPDVGRIVAAMVAEGIVAGAGAIENDHIALRTLGVPHLGIASLEKIFLHYGYERRDRYAFAAKKLDACWYSPPSPDLPRIFVSELRVGELSPLAQTLVRSYTANVQADPVDAIDLNDGAAVDALLHRALWRLPTYADYRRLLDESEYAAWTIYNRYSLNHFTISVQNLPGAYASLTAFDAFLERSGIRLNDAGGTIKTSPDGLLLQSSTIAQLVEAPFAEGTRHPIAGPYIEFAERRVLPQFAHLPAAAIRREHRRDGFEAANADRIFESTYTSQITRS